MMEYILSTNLYSEIMIGVSLFLLMILVSIMISRRNNTFYDYKVIAWTSAIALVCFNAWYRRFAHVGDHDPFWPTQIAWTMLAATSGIMVIEVIVIVRKRGTNANQPEGHFPTRAIFGRLRSGKAVHPDGRTERDPE